MNKFLRTIIWLGIIMLALSVTALSCNKAGGDNKNNNNNPGGGGGGGDSGPPKAEIIFTNFDTAVAEMVNGTIELKASGFSATPVSADVTGPDADDIVNSTSGAFKKAFEIVMKSGGTLATGGLVMVGPGNLGVNDFSLRGVDDLLTAYPAEQQREGIVTEVKATFAGNAADRPPGWSIYGIFSKPDAPKAATKGPDSSPFAFTPTTGARATQPALFCRSTISSITFPNGNNRNTVAFDDKTTLAGGEKASCYVINFGAAFIERTALEWLDTAAGDNFKKKFNIAVAGIRTDAKTVAQLGLSGVDDAAKAAAFRDGITKDEMKTIATGHSSGYTNIAVEVVKDAGFTYAPPATLDIKATSPATGVTIDNANNTITIAASAFPTAAADSDITKGFEVLSGAAANSLTNAFDITFTGGTGAITGGIVLVGPGNFTGIDSFSDRTTGRGLNGSIPGTFKEGFGSGAPTVAGNVNANGYNASGMSYYGIFMNDTAPTATTKGADSSPFAFSPTTTEGTDNTQPFLFCRATVTSFTTAILDMNRSYAGGQTARCYIGAKGAAFTGTAATAWTGKTAGDTFKKEFKIAVGAIRTDALTLDQFLPGASGAVSKLTSTTDGLDEADFRHMVNTYPNGFETFTVRLVP